jgi:hypothetical protein
MPLDNIDNATTGNTPTPVTPQDQQAAANTSPAQDTSAQNQPGNTAPQFQSPTSTAPGVPAQPQQTKSKDPNQQMISGAAAAQPDPVQSHPLVQKAGILNAVATALSGGPRYTETINDQGVRVRTPAPLTGRQIGMAIAMEAIQGSLAGLQAGRGRGMGAAGLAGFQQVQKQTQQRDDQQDQKAQQDFVNKASAYAANLRTRSMAQEVGMRDEAAHKDWVAQHASTVNYIRENNPASIIKDDASEAEVTTPEFTKQALKNGWTAIPVGYEPRFDAQGNHFTKDGVAMHNNTFMIVDSRKLALQPDVIAKAQSWGLPGFTNRNGEPLKLADNLDVRVGTIIDTSNKVAALDQEQRDLNGYYGYLADKGVKGPDGKPLVAPDLKTLVKQNPTLISNITGPWANHFGDSPSAAFKAMKDNVPGKGALLNLYGGTQLLDKYDLLKDTEKKGAEETTAANVAVKKERDLIPIKVATAGGEAKARAAAMATSSKNEDGSWNPASIPVSLVEANMDPSQLSKRGTDYNQKLQDANAYSLQKYGRPFDIAQATTDYKQANNPQVQSMLKMVGAMSAPNGELAIAVNAAKALPQLNSGMLNKVFNITETQFGSDSVTNFHTAMIGFSDLYAKVMGGGAGTDALRQSAMDVLKDGYSHGQIAGSIKVLQQQIEARKAQMIGENPYLRKQFGGQAQVPNTNNVQAPPASLLKEGVNTKFANGQVWSLRSGQPVQVQ